MQCKERRVRKNTTVGDLATPINSLEISYRNVERRSNNYFYKQIVIKLAA